MSINMIRTTISRIKRVWAVTFSPGLLRGDVRITPGKFHMLSSTQSPLPRRSKSSDSACKNRPWTRCGGAAASEEKEVFEDYLSSDMRAKETMHGAPPLYKTTSACRCDECNRIIAEIFGEETSSAQDKDLKRKLLTNIAQVSLTDNFDSGKYATDKGQHGLFQRKKKGEDGSLPKLNKDDIDSKVTTNTNNKSNPIDELVLSDTFNEKTKKDHVDAHQMYTNLYDVDPEEYQCKITVDEKSSHLGKKDHNVDAYWKDVYETAVGENSVYCEQHTLSIDEDTLNVYKVLKDTNSKLDSTSKYRRLKPSPRELERMIAGEKLFINSSERELDKRYAIRASTEKQDDDKLIQKVEHIDEAPLVEAEKPKVDGSQTTPRVLGYVGKGKGFNSLDEVAQRCLTSPQNQIDEILLKEMEKLGIPLTLQRNNACRKVDDNKPDNLNKQKKVPQGEEIELDDRNIQSKPEKWREAASECKEDHPLDTVTQFHLDLNRTKMHDDSKMKEKTNFKSETVCDANSENQNGCSFWHTRNSQQQQNPKRSGTTEQGYNTFADRMWQKNQLDPKHVLTCNETCSISPKPLVHKNVEDVKGTEDMYEQQHRNLYMKDKPLLEEGESEPLATRTEDEPQHVFKPDYLNRSKPVDFTDITKNNASTAVEGVEQQTSITDSSNVTPTELPRREVDIEPREEPKNAEDPTEQIVIQVVDSEQLQLTTEQLQAASEQLQATCEHLQTTTEQLQAATTQLQATGNHLCDSSDKLCTASENLNTTTEKLKHTSENLRESTEQLSYEQQMLINKLSNDPKKESYNSNEEAERTVKLYGQFIKQTPGHKEQLKMASTETFINDTIKSAMHTPKPTKDLSVNPAAAALISEAVSGSIKDIKTEKPSSQEVETKGTDEAKSEKTEGGGETDFKELDNKCFSPNIEGWAQQATTINPSVPMTEDLPPIKPLPEINENIKLSELLKMVRERNRLVDSNEAVVLQKSKKPVPPLAKPMANPPMFNMPSIPYVKPNPRVCKPKKKGTNKCSRCNLETLGLGETTSFIGRNERRECLDVVNLDQHQTIDMTLAEDDFITDLVDDFILQLHSLGNTIESSFKRGKAEVLEAAVVEKDCHLTNMVRSQNYDPWSPIPSWPYPKKSKQQKLQCPKDGCQIPPPVSLEDRPCGLKPCKTFPTFPKRTFSLLDCYPATLSDHKIVDVGDF